MAAIAWAIVLAVAFRMPWAWLDTKLPKRRGAAALLLTLAIVLADNVLRPLLLRRSPEMSMMVAFLGVLGGIAAFGLVGIFIGPMALAAAATLRGVLRRWAGAARRQAPSPPAPLAGTG